MNLKGSSRGEPLGSEIICKCYYSDNTIVIFTKKFN